MVDVTGRYKLSYWPKWDDAKKGILPPVGLFARNSVIKLVGCKTASFARGMSEKLLLGNEAFAWGSKLPTCYTISGAMGFGKPGPVWDKKQHRWVEGIVLDIKQGIYATPDAYFTSRQWKQIKGSNKGYPKP